MFLSPLSRRLSRQSILPRPLNHPREHINANILPNLRLLSLVIRVARHLDIITLDRPLAHLADELLGSLEVEAQPRLQVRQADLPKGLRDEVGDAVPDDVLEAVDVGDEVGADVVAVERRPEPLVLGALEGRVEVAEGRHGLVELGAGGRGGVDEVEGEGELWGGELRHGFDEDVADDFIF